MEPVLMGMGPLDGVMVVVEVDVEVSGAVGVELSNLLDVALGAGCGQEAPHPPLG